MKGARDPGLTRNFSAQGFSARKWSSHNFWLWKPAKIVAEWDRGLPDSQGFLLKGPHINFFINILTLHSSTGTAAWDEPETYKEEMNYLISGLELERQFSHREKCCQNPWFLCQTLSLLECRNHIWESNNLANTPHSGLILLWDPSSPTLQAHPSHFWLLFHSNGLS